METKSKMRSPHPRIVVGLPAIQDQIRMINRVAGTAAEQEQERWKDVKELLAELYSQLQRKDRVTVHRLAKRSFSKDGSNRHRFPRGLD